jgi:hypothetical protein
MKKALLALLAIIILAVGFWMARPLFVNKEVNESVEELMGETEAAEVLTLASGSFEGRAGHRGSGTASLIEIDGKSYLRFEDDFDIQNGPDLFVHFGNDGEYDREASLGRLKGNIGGQNYEIPEGVDPQDYSEVWVWCRAFSTPFVVAELQ